MTQVPPTNPPHWPQNRTTATDHIKTARTVIIQATILSPRVTSHQSVLPQKRHVFMPHSPCEPGPFALAGHLHAVRAAGLHDFFQAFI